MSLNFCPNCGDELVSVTKFCPNCGNELNVKIDSISKDTESISFSDVNFNAPAPAKIGYGNDMKSDRVIAYKRAMGLEPTDDNVVVGQSANMVRMLISTAYAALTQKWFVLSFEKDGILFIGLNNLSRFTGKNIFIPKESISDISYRGGLLRKVLSVTVDGRTNKYYLSKVIMVCDFQSKNMENLDDLIDQYK